MPSAVRKKILVLDIDAGRLIVLEQMLQDAGYDATTTWDIRRARELFDGDGFSLVLVGEHPPEISRADVHDAVWSKAPSVPCIIMRSAFDAVEVEDRCPRAPGAMTRCTLAEVVNRINYLLHLTTENELPKASSVSAA